MHINFNYILNIVTAAVITPCSHFQEGNSIHICNMSCVMTELLNKRGKEKFHNIESHVI